MNYDKQEAQQARNNICGNACGPKDVQAAEGHIMGGVGCDPKYYKNPQPSEAELLSKQLEHVKFVERQTAQIGAQINCLGGHTAMTVGKLQSLVYEAMCLKGFWSEGQENFGQKVALIHSEVTELLEANRKSIRYDDHIPDYSGEEAEAADIMIRLLDLAGRRGWRLGEAVTAKMLYNLSRPYKHDKAY